MHTCLEHGHCSVTNALCIIEVVHMAFFIKKGVEVMQTNEASQESEIKQIIRSLCMMNNRFMNFMLDDNKKAAQVSCALSWEMIKLK